MQHESTFLLASDSGGIEVDRNRLLLSEYFVTQCKEYLIKYSQVYTASVSDTDIKNESVVEKQHGKGFDMKHESVTEK